MKPRIFSNLLGIILSLSLNNYPVLTNILIFIDNCAIIAFIDYFLREKVSDHFPYPLVQITLFLMPQNEVVSTPKAKIITVFYNFLQKKPWNKLKLYCKAQLCSSAGRTEHIPLLHKRLDEMIECN